MKKTVCRFYICLFVLAFILPAPLYYAMKGVLDTRNRENKPISAPPAITAENYSVYPRKVEDWLKGIMPFKNQLATIGGAADYYLFHETLQRGVVVGKEGWLFYTDRQNKIEAPIEDYLGTDLFTEEELQLAAANLCAAADYMEERGGEFLCVFSPSKMSLYPEYLPDRFGEPAEYKRMQQLVEYLRENTDLRIIWTCETLTAFKEAHPQEHVFLMHDTHESDIGGYLGAQQIIEELGLESLPPMESLGKREKEEKEADLANMLGIRSMVYDEFNEWEYDFRREDVLCRISEDGCHVRYSNPYPDADPRKLVMASDSFGEGMLAYLADYFTDSYLVFPNGYEPEILEKEAPDILIFQSTERLYENVLEFTVPSP